MGKIDIEKINAEIAQDAKDFLQILWDEMMDELNKLFQSGHFTPALLVSKIRDYNRKWNEKAEKEKYLLPDGFKTFVKKQLIEDSEFTPKFINALKYL